MTQTKPKPKPITGRCNEHCQDTFIELRYVDHNLWRVYVCKDGDTTNIVEAANVYTLARILRNRVDDGISIRTIWPVNYGRAKRLDTRFVKAAAQMPATLCQQKGT